MTDAASLPDDAGLARMKRVALALLGAAALLYVVAVRLDATHAAWSYVAAFAEAAMVGAVADWFAVVALFRHPLGLPIPHTAIIPRNKARIGRNLAGFICAHFLSTSQVLERLRHVDAPARLADWLADDSRADRLGGYLADALRYAMVVLDDERVRVFFRRAALARMEALDLSELGGQLIDALRGQGRHQQLLDAGLRQLSTLLEDAAVRAELAEVVAGEVKVLRLVGLDQVAGRYAADKIVAGLGRLVGEMSADPEHPLRVRFEAFVVSFVERLKSEPELRARGEGLKSELLAHPALADTLHGVWSDVVEWMRGDLSREDSAIRQQLALGARTLGEKLRADAAMRDWFEEQLEAAAPRWIERYREDIRRYIVERVAAWNADEMTVELERNIGRDLQFIRINGTLVGGGVGLAIHTATQWLR